jgi:hypothetical protein
MTSIYQTVQAGTVKYNGLELNPTVQYSLEARIVMDDAERAYKHTEYTLHGKFVIFGDTDEGSQTTYAESTTAQKMVEVRNLLSQPGKRLQLTNIGFGAVDINGKTAPITNDVSFGPKPDVLEFAPFGALAWEVIWSCRYCVTEPTRSTSSSLLALNYEMGFSHDMRGITTINVNGHYQVPLSLSGYALGTGGLLSSSTNPADAYLDHLSIQIPEDFRLGEKTHTFNAARNRVEFTYQLIELDGEAFPPGIVWADIDEDWENSEPQSFSGWNGSIRGELEVAKGYPTTTAARKFLDIFVSRLNYIRGQVTQKHGGGKDSPVILPVRFSFGCKRFTRKYRFAAEYVVLGCIPDFIGGSGIWQPLGTKHNEWITSMAEVNGNRGVSKVKPGIDIILNTGNSAATRSHKIDFKTTKPQDTSPVNTLTFDCSGINEHNSYLAYENNVRVVKEASYSISKYAQTPGNREAAGTGFVLDNQPTSAGSSDAAKLVERIANSGNIFGQAAKAVDAVGTALTTYFAGSAVPATGSGNPDVVEYTGISSDYIVMSGKAMRLKYPPQVPTISKIGENESRIFEEQVDSPRVIGMVGDCPVYVIRWAKVYYFPKGFRGTELAPTTSAQWACMQPFG